MEEPLQEVISKRTYREYAKLCRRGLKAVLLDIENICEDYEPDDTIDVDDEDLDDIDMDNNYNGFIITSRVKKFKSVVKKCRKKGYPATLDGIATNIQDIAGIRILAPTLTDVNRIREEIYAEFEVITEDDYIESPKPSGYRSLHLVIKKQVRYKKVKKSVAVEIQIRTYAQHGWSYIEREAVYGNPNPSDEIRQKLIDRSKSVLEFDNEMDAIFHDFDD